MYLRRSTRVVAAAAALLLAASACTGGGDDGKAAAKPDGPPDVPSLEQLGAAEGQLELVARAGYVENGSTDPKVNWVTPFEQASGCKVNVTVAESSDEMLTMTRSGQYDAVAAPGDISGALIDGGVVAPVNTDLIPNYADVFDGLKGQPWNSVRDTAYGVPHGRGANLLMWRTDVVKPAPQSWDVVYAETSPYRGKISTHDTPMAIADAAVYLMKAQPELGITDPYALDDEQFAAAVDVLRKQRPNISAYWREYSAEVAAFKSGTAVVGNTWQSIASLAQTEKAPVQAVLPAEGATGFSDTWMVAAKAKHPNCAYKWFDHVLSPAVNAQVAEWFGQAPSNRQACARTVDKNFCATHHATDEAYHDKVWYWRTPAKKCVDGREGECTDRDAWVKAWAEIKG
jgi:putative spermidine/putrescine transport system substrate-binding protein